MKKGDSLSFGAHARCFVDQPDSSGAATGQGVVQILDGKADMMNTGTATVDESRDRRIVGPRLEQLDELRACGKAGNASTIGILEWMIIEAEKITIEGKHLVDRAYGDSNVRDTRSTTSSGWHENRAPYMV
jgi:hypothetical protein